MTLRVAFVITSLGAGGSERSTALLTQRLRDRGIDVAVITCKRAEEGDEEALRSAGIPVHQLSSRRWPGRVREARRVLRDFEPDVVHTALFEGDMVGRSAAVGLDATVVSSLVNTSYDPVRLEDPRIRPGRLRAVRLADAVTARLMVDRFHAVSQGVADANIEALGLRRSRVHVVERGRDLHEFRPADACERAVTRQQLGIDPHATVLLTVGREEYQKGHDDLVAATEMLIGAGRSIEVVVAGRRGNASERIDELLAGSDLPIRRLGHRDDIPELLRAADVFILPSRYEGTAGAAIEAMATGLPMVLTDVQGLSGIVTHELECLLVPPGEPRSLAVAVERVLDDASLATRLSTAARSAACRFDLTTSTDRMIAFYAAARGER